MTAEMGFFPVARGPTEPEGRIRDRSWGQRGSTTPWRGRRPEMGSGRGPGRFLEVPGRRQTLRGTVSLGYLARPHPGLGGSRGSRVLQGLQWAPFRAVRALTTSASTEQCGQTCGPGKFPGGGPLAFHGLSGDGGRRAADCNGAKRRCRPLSRSRAEFQGSNGGVLNRAQPF